ncbi:Nramp family divalent metal transporter [Salicibibacter cibarius]|uniref:Nramp family divalent metal transporter n=1 Tax=Salicibibacter cibarius TaxID=2743000 RepID=A0A7T7CDI7_9BACI|nr:Nramp family divalent metal transporter [Salicibibacter cibarius]QQK78029.1 Nramp family divalent metal transporter [Salicibibacter cibarius]
MENNTLFARFISKLKVIGPGAIIAASFIGPGTVSTATEAGASFGYALLWAVLFSIVTTMILQGMASKIGIVTGSGLGEAIRDQFKRPVLKYITVTVVGVSIATGCAAYMAGDLTGGALGLTLITGIPQNYIAPVLGTIILVLGLMGTYKVFEKILIVLVGIMSITFITTMVVVQPDVLAIFEGAFTPSIPSGSIVIIVALIGTTVVPYNLFLHASSAHERWNSPADLKKSRLDILITIGIGGLITAAVLITSAAVMRGTDVTGIEQLAVALEPTLGEWATVFISIGLLAAGFSSALAASMGAAYTIGGVANWGTGFDNPRFKMVFIIVISIGVITSATGFEPLELILFAQALNGLILPIIAIFLLIVVNNKNLLGQYVNSIKLNIIGGLIVLIVSALGIYSLVEAILDFITEV